MFQENQAMGKRKRHTNTEKLAIARKALLLGYNISSVARGESLSESTVRGCVNNLKKLEEDAVESNYGSIKSMHSDKTPTLTVGLKAGKKPLNLLRLLQFRLFPPK
jgi:hypothetical protein